MERALSASVETLIGKAYVARGVPGETSCRLSPLSRDALENLEMVKGGGRPEGTPGGKGSKMRTDTQGFGAEREAAQIDPRIQGEIGKHLRAIYDDVINEPVPSKFMELLEKLERSTTQKG